MPNTIQLKRSSTAAAVPSAGVLSLGELAVNTVDEKIFFKNSAGTVKALSATADLTNNLVTIATTQSITGDKDFAYANISTLDVGNLYAYSPSSFYDTVEFSGDIYVGGVAKLGYVNTNLLSGDSFTGATITTGTNNAMFGWQAARDLSTGSNNTGIGYRANRLLTTGGSNTAVGSLALSSATTPNYNSAIGHNALLSTTTGGENVAVGAGALQVNTTGIRNTAIGAFALNEASSTASNNTAIGYVALLKNTTGTGNLAIGVDSLRSCTTSSYNIAIGNASLVSCTTGSGSNVAIGNNAAYRLTTGQFNTAIGFQALFGSAAVTSQANTAIGYNSMVSNTSGSYNSGIGINSLYSLTTGQQNTAVGTESLYAITTTSNNSAVGQLALRYATQGQNNTAVGILAGAYKTASNTNLVTIGNNCTFIGAESRASGDNASDEVVIGYQAVGIGSNTVTIGKSTNVANRFYGVVSTGEAAPTIASANTIAPTQPITFISGTTQINTITAPTGISTSGGQITLIPTGLFTTGTTGNIALATTAVVNRALIMTYDSTTTKWYPSY